MEDIKGSAWCLSVDLLDRENEVVFLKVEKMRMSCILAKDYVHNVIIISPYRNKISY